MALLIVIIDFNPSLSSPAILFSWMFVVMETIEFLTSHVKSEVNMASGMLSAFAVYKQTVEKEGKKMDEDKRPKVG